MEITATKNGRSVSVEYDLGANHAESVKLFGPECVYSGFVSSAKIDAQSVMRRGIEQNKPDEEIASIMAGWTPPTGGRREGAVSLVERALKLLARASGKEREEILAKLTE